MKRFSQLTQTATEADLGAGNFLAIDVPGVGGATKKVPGNLVAPKSVQDNLCASVAKEFLETEDYFVGEFVQLNGKAYRFIADHAAGAFDASEVKEEPVSNYCLRQGGKEFYFASVADGYLEEDGTIATSDTRGVSDYIDVEGLLAIEPASGVASILNAHFTFLAFYDSTKTFMKAVKYTSAVNNVQNVVVPVPSAAKYVRVTLAAKATPAQVILYGLAQRVASLEEFVDGANLEQTLDTSSEGYLNTDGTIATSTTRGVSDYIDLTDFEKVETISGVASIANSQKTFACFYDSEKTFVSAEKYASLSENVQANVAIPSGAKYMRVTLAAKDTPAHVALIGYGVVKRLQADVADLQEKDEGNTLSEVVYSYEDGFLNADGTIATSTTRGVSDYIDVEGTTEINTLAGIASIWASRFAFACLFDAGKNFLIPVKFTSAVEDVEANVKIPSAAKYIRFTIANKSKPAIINRVEVNGVQKLASMLDYSQCKNGGKKFALFGGSLTYNFFVTYKMAAAWVKALNISDFKFYGVGGAGFSNTLAQSIQTQVTNASANSDVFVLWASGNDYYNQVEPGTSSDYTSDDSYDENKRATQAGGMNYCIKKIYEKNPNATIVLFTSLPIFQSRNGWIKEAGSGASHTLFDYVKVQKEVAARWGIPCYDQFMDCGFGELNYTEYYQPDAGHITDDGYNKIILRQAEFIANAP